MKNFFFILPLTVVFLCSSCRTDPDRYDIVVYGGTSAGVIAAYTAAKMGKRVVLIEPGKHLGGLTTGGLGYTDIGNKFAITGLSRDFYRRLGQHYGKFEQWIFEPHVAEALMLDYIRRGKVEVRFQHRVTDVLKEDGLISAMTLEDISSDEPVAVTVRGSMFIDCSYEGDLMAEAGVSYTIGRESNATYGEDYNGVQLMTGHQFPDGVDPYVVKGDPTSGLLWGISSDSLAANGTGDRKLQAYNFRICLTNDSANMVPIRRPVNYDSSRFELLLRLFDAQPEKRSLHHYFIWSRMPNGKTDINNRGGFSTDMIGMNYAYADGDYDTRKAIVQDHVQYTKGLLYFYGHDPRVPEPLREEMLKWGYPRDEYTDNDHWSPQLYVREVRRMVGDYVMTQANCQGREVVPDGVGMAAYTMDSHNCQRVVVDGMVKNEGNVEIGGFGPYPIAYRSLIPKAAECGNLLVPVCLSASHIAYGSIRMEPVFMVLGQSAAVAAAMALDEGKTVQEVDVPKLQATLAADPLADGSRPEILLDNDDANRVGITGNWSKRDKGGYGPSWLIFDDSLDTAGGSVTFSADMPTGGTFDVYYYFPMDKQMSAHTRLVVAHGATADTVTVRKEEIRVEGQTSGEWFLLGRYGFDDRSKASVTVSADGADGAVVADAVLLIPARE